MQFFSPHPASSVYLVRFVLGGRGQPSVTLVVSLSRKIFRCLTTATKSPFPLLFCKKRLYLWLWPSKQLRQFQLKSHMENLFEPDGPCSLTSSGRVKKTLGWLLPGLLWGNGERLVHPFPFLALPRHVRDEPSPKKSRPAVAFGPTESRTVW